MKTSMRAYYNENDPKAAAWLRELIRAGHIADGDVDERSILDVTPMDVAGYTQCHFFAGIGGWSYALRLAGWSDARNVWTGSCPCQPFSAAGKGGGFSDEQHLWPVWHHLIEESRPPVIFGEQVASKAGLEWFDLVHADLEDANYAVGAFDLCAASVGAPHIRQRLYFVADHTESRLDTNVAVERAETLHDSGQEQSERRGSTGELGHTDTQRQQQHAELDGQPLAGAITSRGADFSRSDYVDCRDGKRRPIEPGTFPLAHGVPHRVGLLRGYGNAIVAPLAADFIAAYADTRGLLR